jgi:hypothetical protein
MTEPSTRGASTCLPKMIEAPPEGRKAAPTGTVVAVVGGDTTTATLG